MLTRICLLVLGLMVVSRPVHAQTTWLVDDDTCPAMGDGTNLAPFCSIQDAIDAASDLDEIIVAIGTYNEAIDFLGKTITVRSTDPTDRAVVLATIIDGTAANALHVVTCINGEGPQTVLTGFTITGGDASGVAHPDFRGGGMLILNSSPTVSCCSFSGNVAAATGGGMYIADGSPSVTNCAFGTNSADTGGGLFIANAMPTVRNCAFRRNTSVSSGGGLYNSVNADSIIINCRFEANAAGGSAGGMLNFSCTPMITGCDFIANTASTIGGAMANSSADPVMADCTITANIAGGAGGGMFNLTSVSVGVMDTLICGNSPDQVDGDPFIDSGGNIINDICPPPKDAATGACCVAGNCLTLTAADCALVGGTYQGDDTDCGAIVCPAACIADFTSAGDGPPDGLVGIADFLRVLADWGVCP